MPTPGASTWPWEASNCVAKAFHWKPHNIELTQSPVLTSPELGSKLTNIGRAWPKLTQLRPNDGKLRPSSANVWPTSTGSTSHLVGIAQVLPEIDRARANGQIEARLEANYIRA